MAKSGPQFTASGRRDFQLLVSAKTREADTSKLPAGVQADPVSEMSVKASEIKITKDSTGQSLLIEARTSVKKSILNWRTW